MERKKIIVGISGATGIQYGIKALELLRKQNIETHLVMSKAAEMVRTYETEIKHDDILQLADVVYPLQDIGAAIASGSFKTSGMLVAPCSIKTMSEIATGVTSTLLSRAADVVLKERRRLILMVRETPFHAGHLKTMLSLTEMGAIIMPPVPGLYMNPQSIDEMITHSVARALDLLDVEVDVPRWNNEHRVE
ncbi:MAG: aromatic acid decarboxylase [Pseudopedobacter saltans]|uniref:Flavin prenyltransferase UbiX n=1 Tax=Pseudopedobacter saltans TaxID=151895 RepID=A0A2W5H1P2_9SPHI|nr:MAG: aromatic acid decarboxylase [Pseudopedobacter saltans]